jgi:hypothetical protein
MWQVRVRACSGVCFDRPSSQNEQVSGNKRSMMRQFQYHIGHCEIAMDTSMTSPLSTRITNKGRHWFAQSTWLWRFALNSLNFYCSPAHFLLEDLVQDPRGRSLEYARYRPRNWGGSAGSLAEFFSRRTSLLLLLRSPRTQGVRRGAVGPTVRLTLEP